MTTALALFSGGLDSILSCRLVAAQGIKVRAIRFVTPFFGYDLLAREDEYRAEVKKKYGIEVVLRDVSGAYFTMLRSPRHGYGKHFNPCVDCKILLLTEARKLMSEFSASFIITGEVIGQRPMSQRRDTLRVIERDSGCTGLLLRPLCAKNLSPTPAEIEGLIDREGLLAFNGRSRQPQFRLARSFGICDFPAPAGGCMLTEEHPARRIAWYFAHYPEVKINAIRSLLFGRHFKLPGGGWLTLGRDERENDKLTALAGPEDTLLLMPDWSGPTGLLRGAGGSEDISAAAGLIARYAKKRGDGEGPAAVLLEGRGQRYLLTPSPLADEHFRAWML